MRSTTIASALDTVKRFLLDADVEYSVVKDFDASVKERCLGEVVQTKLKFQGLSASPGDHFIEQCQVTLQEYLGGDVAPLARASGNEPTIVLLVGLQGAGKTTHAAKLARFLRDEQVFKLLLVAADVYRPAARHQLRTLADRESIGFFTSDSTDAVQTAKAFHEKLSLTGVILTKLDGDTRGGAALSVKRVTGYPILFAGTGEGIAQLEEFRPEGMATRILGLGDIVGLMGDFERAVDEEQAARSAERLMQGQFDFNDFLEMMGSIQKMGPLKDIISKTPLMGELQDDALDKVDDRELVCVAALVHSMTKKEKQQPELLLQSSPGGRSRMSRIARGSGRSEKDVKELVERFMQMRQVMGLMMGFGGGGLL